MSSDRSEAPGDHGACRRRDRPGVQVNLARPEDDDIPVSVDGVPVRVRVVGAVRAQR